MKLEHRARELFSLLLLECFAAGVYMFDGLRAQSNTECWLWFVVLVWYNFRLGSIILVSILTCFCRNLFKILPIDFDTLTRFRHKYCYGLKDIYEGELTFSSRNPKVLHFISRYHESRWVWKKFQTQHEEDLCFRFHKKENLKNLSESVFIADTYKTHKLKNLILQCL